MIDKDQALILREFFIVESDYWHGGKKRVITVRRNGKTKTWKRDPERWDIPVKYGLNTCFHILSHDARFLFASREDAQLSIDYPGAPVDEARARKIASDYHNGQWSAMYAFASSGVIKDYEQLIADVVDANASGEEEGDNEELRFLYDYVTEQYAAGGVIESVSV